VKYARLIAVEAHKRKQKPAVSWRMDETYIKVKGKWTYYYRAIDKFGKTLDFMLSEHRDEAAATAFFARAIGSNGFPDRVVIDKSGANLAGLQNMNCLLPAISSLFSTQNGSTDDPFQLHGLNPIHRVSDTPPAGQIPEQHH
jgi:transposase-like protein